MRWTLIPIALGFIPPGCKIQTLNARDPIRPSSGDASIIPSAPVPALDSTTPELEKSMPVPTSKPMVLDTPKGCSGESVLESFGLRVLKGFQN